MRRINETGGQAAAFQADVAVGSECKKLVDGAVQHLRQLDILINNAGTTTFEPPNGLEALTEQI